MNILDVAQNSVRAGADLVEILLERNEDTACLSLVIRDDGCGMDGETLAKAVDPFFTTRTTRGVGLGLSFLKMSAEMTDGAFAIDSEPGRGTEVQASFTIGHIDLMPLGDMGETVSLLAAVSPSLELLFSYKLHRDGREAGFVFDTREAREILGGVPFSEPSVALFIKEYINENLEDIENRFTSGEG